MNCYEKRIEARVSNKGLVARTVFYANLFRCGAVVGRELLHSTVLPCLQSQREKLRGGLQRTHYINYTIHVSNVRVCKKIGAHFRTRVAAHEIEACPV